MAFLFSTALLYSIGSFDLRRLRIRASEMPDELLSMVLRSPVSAGKPSFAAYKATKRLTVLCTVLLTLAIIQTRLSEHL